MNPFYVLSSFFQRMSKVEARLPVNDCLFVEFADQDIGNDAVKIKFRVLALFDECLSVLSLMELPSDKLERMIARVHAAKASFLYVCSLNTVGEFNGHMQPHIDILEAYGNSAYTSKKFTFEMLDRNAFFKSTVELVEKVTQSNLPSYQKEVLRLKLSAVARIVLECDYMTDSQIRTRVKTIYADFCGEFESNDRQHQDVKEKILEWVRALMTPGLFGLALTADASAVVALLTGPN